MSESRSPSRFDGDFFDVVFDGPPGPESGRFVEVEDSIGRGMSIGEWVHRSDGYWALRIKNVGLTERTAQIAAHRACCGTEHDAANGKLHGYCVVCGVPWPCEYAGKPPAVEPPARRCTCYVLPHTDDCGLFVGITQAGERVFAEEVVAPSETPATVPAGWKLVPVELTEPMRIAGYLYKDKLGAQALYRALLAAAPEAAK